MKETVMDFQVFLAMPTHLNVTNFFEMASNLAEGQLHPVNPADPVKTRNQNRIDSFQNPTAKKELVLHLKPAWSYSLRRSEPVI